MHTCRFFFPRNKDKETIVSDSKGNFEGHDGVEGKDTLLLEIFGRTFACELFRIIYRSKQ